VSESNKSVNQSKLGTDLKWVREAYKKQAETKAKDPVVNVDPKWSREALEKEAEDKENRKPVKESRLIFKWWKVSEICILGPLFLLGILFSVIHLYVWGIPTWREAHRYVSARCVVENRYVHSWVDRNGHVGYRPEILIRFEDRAGQSFLCRAYDESTLTEGKGYTYTLEEATKAAQEFEPGTVCICHYQPEEPTRVLLKRHFEIWGWLFLVIPVSISVLGASVLIWLAKRRSLSREWLAKPIKNRRRYPTVPAARQINESPGIDLAYRLPMTLSPIIQNLAGLAISFLWNLVAVGTFAFVLSVRSDRLDLILAMLFGLTYGGIGILALIVFSRRVIRTLRTGTTILEISNHPVFPNRTYRLSLRQNGFLVAKSYTIDLVCDEIARFRDGTDTLTNKQEVLRIPLYARDDLRIPSGETFREEFFLKIPAGAMHSFQTDSNEIRWKVSVLIKTGKTGTIRRECPIIILPYSPGAN
jgi:uncharacterized membrane protein YedE/YeeE